MNWISVKDRLPEPDKRVLAIDAKDGFHYIAYVCGEMGGWWDDVSGSNNHITHWMPLPEKPSCNCGFQHHPDYEHNRNL